MAGKHHGFALPSGDFEEAKIVILLETPATNEIVWPVRDLPDGLVEIERRREQWPSLTNGFIERGAAVVGASGSILFDWMLKPFGIPRMDIGLVNTLHCYPGKKPDGTVAYPIGDVRKRAEACCQTLWWKQLEEWKPTISIVCLHPAALSRECSPLPICLKVVEKAKHFSLQGERVLILMGGKATKAWLGYAENTTVWCGHYQRETTGTVAARERRREAGMAIKVGEKKVKVKKLTVRTALELLLKNAQPVIDGDGNVVEMAVDARISEAQYKEMCGLLVPKTKKEKK